MRKNILMVAAVMMLVACGGQTKNAALDTDSTQVFEIPDTLNTAEATTRHLPAVCLHHRELTRIRRTQQL